VDDKGCRKLGEFVVNIPNPTDERRYVLVEFTFGDTEIRAKATERDSSLIMGVPSDGYFRKALTTLH
jgi:hypothetical protein